MYYLRKRYYKNLILQFLNTNWIKLSVPMLLFGFVMSSNVVETHAYVEPEYSAKTIDPATRTFILGEIDKYTPIIEERRDIDRIMLLEQEGEFVVQKPTLVETEFTDLREEETKRVEERRQTIYHIVQSGETLSEIGMKYGLKLKTLLAANQDLINQDSLKVGDKLIIPVEDYDPTYADRLLAKKSAKLSRTASTTKSGSTLAKSSGSSISVIGDNCVRPVNYSYVSRRLLRYHSGVDMVAPTGTPVYASCSGTISSISGGWSGGYGLNVKVSQDNGDLAIYAHLSSVSDSIYVGQHINAGTYLGGVGSTGRSTGSHLHFEVRRSGRPIDYGF